MTAKKIIVWIIKAVLLLILTFIALITMDFCLSPYWLTGNMAVVVLVMVLVLHTAVSIVSSQKHGKNTGKKDAVRDRNVRNLNSARTAERGGERRTQKKQMIAGVVAVALIIGLAWNEFYDRDTAGVPRNIVSFGEKYPEAWEYVENYNKYANADLDMDVSRELAESDIPLFIQWDKRWGYRNYGGNYVGVAGCGPTCLAMVICGLEQDPDINPYVVSSYASDQGYYVYGQGTSWSFMTEGAEQYGLDATCGSVSSDYILTNLSSDTPMICSMAPGDFTKAGHFIVLAGIDEDGRIIVNDPNSPRNSSKHWDVDTLVSQMKGVWKYSHS
ncbi:MAG: C39 family peptidase [Lachnospiraceae bacterium]|nr:C39 family peptidase [Lachnospiraceae bacterium]